MPQKPKQSKDLTLDVLDFLMAEGYKEPKKRKKRIAEDGEEWMDEMDEEELASTEIGNPSTGALPLPPIFS